MLTPRSRQPKRRRSSAQPRLHSHTKVEPPHPQRTIIEESESEQEEPPMRKVGRTKKTVSVTLVSTPSVPVSTDDCPSRPMPKQSAFHNGRRTMVGKITTSSNPVPSLPLPFVLPQPNPRHVERVPNPPPPEYRESLLQSLPSPTSNRPPRAELFSRLCQNPPSNPTSLYRPASHVPLERVSSTSKRLSSSSTAPFPVQ